MKPSNVLILVTFVAMNSWTALASPTVMRDVELKIVGGTEVALGEIPYQLSLRWNSDHICGASLVKTQDMQIVLTAAHCVNNAPETKELTLVAGEIRSNPFLQTRNVVEIVVHENFTYGQSSLANDIAILWTDHPFDINDKVSTIKLPLESQATTGKVLVSGWGSLDGVGPSLGNLLAVNLTVVDNKMCVDKWDHHPLYPMTIGDGILCANGLNADQLCHGNSGSPARGEYVENQFYLAAIVSFGDPFCRHSDYPVVFTKVAAYLSWINSQVKEAMETAK